MRSPNGPPLTSRGSFCAAIVIALGIGVTVARQTLWSQDSKSIQKPEQKLQQHYDAARTFQVSGDNTRAAAEYRLFLGEALRTAAQIYAGVGDLESAGGSYEDSLKESPDEIDTKLGYAYLKLGQEKFEDAEHLAVDVLKRAPDNFDALLLQGRVAYARGDYKRARESLEAAIVKQSNFDVGYLLGTTYVKLGDFSRARVLFDEMVTGLGDSARIHLYFGRAYAEGDTEGLDKAVVEFKKAIARDAKLFQAHYFLALAYLNRDGESGFGEAAPELRAEIALNPKDYRSRYLLGFITMKQHQSSEAETELQAAAKLEPDNPDSLIYLGQLYSEAGRDKEAEDTLRKAIELTKDVSRGDYQINRAHYVLGRILVKKGQRDEGEKELALSKEIRDRVRNKASKDPDVPSGLAASSAAVEPPAKPLVSPEAKTQVDAQLSHLKPAIADAYNNLGVIMAGEKQFPDAYECFKRARQWQATLQTVDRNLGMAAFYANRFADATEPLARHLEGHSDDLRARAALGLSYFMTQKFPSVLETLTPIASQVDSDPGLAYAYAVSQLKTGSYNEGIRRLKALEETKEHGAEVHQLLGQAYADQNDYAAAIEEYKKSLAVDSNQAQTHFLYGLALLKSGNPAEAIPEFRTANQMSPDANKKYHLAFALIQTQQRDEPRKLLQEVIQQDPKYSDAYYELGKLQLEQGEVKAAITSFETGVKLDPDSDYIHYQLAMAYRRDSRTQDAEREIKLYQSLKNRHRGRDVSQAN